MYMIDVAGRFAVLAPREQTGLPSRGAGWPDRSHLEPAAIDEIIKRAEANGSGMNTKIKAEFRNIFAALVSAIAFYGALTVPATLTAIAIRRKMPDAWFSG